MHTHQIENALYFAKRGFKIFPAIWQNDQHKGLVKWSKHSTSNPDTIKRWGAKFSDNAYFCVALKQSRLTVIDVDIKNGKNGLSTLSALQPLPKTLQSQTPSGGFHLFYNGATRPGANRLGPGVDIPVMVPLPGSITEKGEYSIYTLNKITDLPQKIIDLAGYQQKESTDPATPLTQTDQPRNIIAATQYFTETPGAIEGQGGDNHTFQVIAYAVDRYSLSEPMCFELAYKYFNPHCEPPWEPKDLKTKIHNVYKYKQNPQGASSPEADFETLIKGFRIAAEHKIINPDWLIKGVLERGTVNVSYGETGSLKSFIEIDRALHIATGKDWTGKKTKQGPVLYVAGEGHGGISRRLNAWKIHHKMSDLEWKQIQFYVSEHSMPLLANSVEFKTLTNAVKALKPELIVIDTLSNAFAGGDENSVKDMTTFLGRMFKLRDLNGSAIIIVHHTGHATKERPRGSYSLMGGVDSFWQVESPESLMAVVRTPRKLKDGAPAPDAWFEAEEIVLGVDEDLESVTSLVLNFLPEYQELPKPELFKKYERTFLSVFGDKDCLSKTEHLNLVKSVREEDGFKFHKGNYNRTLTQMAKKGIIEVDSVNITLLNGIKCYISDI